MSEWVSEMEAGSSELQSECGPPNTTVLDSHEEAGQEWGKASGKWEIEAPPGDRENPPQSRGVPVCEWHTGGGLPKTRQRIGV